ncbi:hypothetical protein SAMN05216503_3272 [Polaribacter sp. KT25b]|uniref:hypothetical protein n=1 Tax=Polaribacter sp. KT25b TaxID=1855336 RepID=UPI00087C5368|nr:hypothetical protein [Polaribacter sp. KT25b]SDS50431.1 hypothetical protein SAMN05216503_3272 [Polaribacter sp. KT25b]
MKFKLSTYRTFSGTKQVVELIKKKDTQWVIYQDDKPKFFVDFFDLEKESNAMMNSLVLCGKRSIEEVLELINKRNNINLSIPKITKLGLKKKLKSESIELNLESLPEEWLDYSL